MTIHFFNGETMEIIPIPFLLGLAIIILPLAVIFLIYAKVVTKNGLYVTNVEQDSSQSGIELYLK